MQKLIVVRHGEYDYGTGWLNARGRSQITALAAKLKSFAGGGRIIILSSTAFRAYESAAILAAVFDVGFKTDEILYSDRDRPKKLVEVLELVRSQEQADVLILVTHSEYAESFPGFFAIRILKTGLHSMYIYNGEAWIVDCAKKTLTRVRQDED